jgi:hypothetical protein
VAYKLSADALALMVGVVLGILATIPLSLLIIWMMSKQQTQWAASNRQSLQYSSQPPVIVVQPSAGTSAQPPASLPMPNGERYFKVVGGEEGEALLSEASRTWSD